MLNVDLHVHSRYSDRPSEYVLRRLGIPQSYSSPEDVYERLNGRGMTFKTITDHNTIEGVQKLAHRPDVFISEQVTTLFPDGCKVHLLVWNIAAVQHEEIMERRHDIFALTDYLNHERIAHGVAHPLLNVDGNLTVDHFEKLVLLFRVFQGRNGVQDALMQEVATLCLQALTPEKIEEFANRHNLAPTHDDAHRKVLFAGSDAYSTMHAGSVYMRLKGGMTLADFFASMMRGQAEMVGECGDPLRLASGLYTATSQFISERVKKTMPIAAGLLNKMAERFLAGENPANFSLGERVGFVTSAITTGQAFEFFKPGESTLSVEIGNFFANPKVKSDLDEIIKEEPNVHRRSFRMAAYLANKLTYHLSTDFLAKFNRNSLLEALQSLAGLLPVGAALLPYLMAFQRQAPDRRLLSRVSQSCTGSLAPQLQNTKRAWFTDTLNDVNGVARTIETMVRESVKADKNLTVVTCCREVAVEGIPVMNFEPVGEFEVPEYELQKLSFPPFLEILDYIQRERFTELIISTPGPVGLCALGAGTLLGLPMRGIYHTDFPQYARYLSDDAQMETVTWNYMQWFYGQLEVIYSNSQYYNERWVERGIPAEKLHILPRGLDTNQFSYKHCDPEFWKSRGASGPVLLYVGRVSKEKELGFLADVIEDLGKSGASFTPAFVGDGPYREELMKRLPQAIFTGVLRGDELGAAYASADLFVFPSITDTFGNVVIEAMASGLPALVSDVGGPKELITDATQGRVLPARRRELWVEALQEALANLPSTEARAALSQRIHQERNWAHAFERFWQR